MAEMIREQMKRVAEAEKRLEDAYATGTQDDRSYAWIDLSQEQQELDFLLECQTIEDELK